MASAQRHRILDAAIAMIDRDGLASLTFDSVAANAGLARGGVLHYFPSRRALIEGIDARLVERWELAMVRQLDATSGQSSTTDRHHAFVAGAHLSATRADLLSVLQSLNPGGASTDHAWAEAVRRWVPSPPLAPTPSPREIDRFVARLATHGLWVYQAIYGEQLSDDLRECLVQRIAMLLSGKD